MIEVEHTLEIDRPPEEVFEYLTDVSRLPEWQSSAASATFCCQASAFAGSCSIETTRPEK